MRRERGTRASIHTAYLGHNLTRFRQFHAGPIIAVVKADAYGHGLSRVVPYLDACDAFAVATIEEALELRQINRQKKVILLEGVFNEAEMDLALKHKLDVVVHQDYQLDLLEAQNLAGLDVWLKIDTGMHRLGVTPEQAPDLIEKIRSMDGLGQLRLMTHFARSDQPQSSQTMIQQNHNEWIKSTGLAYSFSNTGAVLNGLSDLQEWARIGIGLFGVSPLLDQPASALELKPVMDLTAKIIATKDLPAGQAVGYGGAFLAESDMKIGVVGIGYADGYPWSGHHAHVVVGDQKVAVLGRVSMDMIAIDLTNVPETTPGTEVHIWGKNMPIESVASELKLIPYALMCGITRRVKFDVVD